MGLVEIQQVLEMLSNVQKLIEGRIQREDPNDTSYITPGQFKSGFASLGADKVSLCELNLPLTGKGSKVDYKEWLRVKTVSRDNNV